MTYIFCMLSLLSSCQTNSENAPALAQAANNSSNEKITSEKRGKIPRPGYLNYSWTSNKKTLNTLVNRVIPPEGYHRIPLEKCSFAEWLRFLPMQNEAWPVKLYNGVLKGNQRAHAAVIDMDVGKADLQQCADAVMRLKAEYHYSRQEYEAIHFNYTSGDKVAFDDWRKGRRPKVAGNKVHFVDNGSVSDEYPNFRAYLKQIFTYAGTASLSKELKQKPLSNILPGDVFIQGGHPGHAVLVLDVAANANGEKVFLIGQSYMPAQDFHLLKNPKNSNGNPWYKTDVNEVLETPEWRFNIEDLMEW